MKYSVFLDKSLKEKITTNNFYGMEREDGSFEESAMERLPDINTHSKYKDKCEENEDMIVKEDYFTRFQNARKNRRDERFKVGESRRSSCPALSDNNILPDSMDGNDTIRRPIVFPPIKPQAQSNKCKSKSSKYGHVSSKYGQQDRDELPPLVERSFVLHENLPVLKVDASLYFLHVMKEIVRT